LVHQWTATIEYKKEGGKMIAVTIKVAGAGPTKKQKPAEAPKK
jgi:hypothetical protein